MDIIRIAARRIYDDGARHFATLTISSVESIQLHGSHTTNDPYHALSVLVDSSGTSCTRPASHYHPGQVSEESPMKFLNVSVNRHIDLS